MGFRSKLFSQGQLGNAMGIQGLGDSDLAPLLQDATPEEKIAYEDMANQPEPIVPPNYNQMAQEEALNPASVPDVADYSGPIAPGVVESGATTPEQFNIARGQAELNPQDKYEQLIAEYRKTREQGEADIEENRKRDKVISIVNALAKGLGGYANAESQKRNAIPGVNVVTPDIKNEPTGAKNAQADSLRKLEALKEQYNMLSKGDQDKLKAEYLDIARRNANLGADRLEHQKEMGEKQTGLRGRSLDLAERKVEMPSDKQVESYTNLKDAKDELARLIPKVKDAGIGPVSSRVKRLKAKTVGGEEAFTEFETDFASVKNSVRNALFGSALTETEKKAFEAELNSLDTNADTFETNLKAYVQRLDRKINEKLGGMEKQGKNVDAFKEPSSAPAQTKVINGVTYEKTDGGWKRK